LRSFLSSEAIGFAGHFIEPAAGVLLLRAAEEVGRFAEAVGGASRFRVTLLAGRSSAHVVIGLFQALEGLLDARICGTLLPGLATLSGLPALPGLARLTGLSGLA
jgi:hypothetical protein